MQENWREVWNKRVMLANFTTEEQARKFFVKHSGAYHGWKVALHPKDGYVVYIEMGGQ